MMHKFSDVRILTNYEVFRSFKNNDMPTLMPVTCNTLFRCK